MAQLQVSIRGTQIRYTANSLDAGVPLHAHEPGSVYEHTTTCEVGKIAVFVYPDTVLIAQAGDPPISWGAGIWHGVMPLELGSAWVNHTHGSTQDDLDNILDSQHNAPQWALDGVKKCNSN